MSLLAGVVVHGAGALTGCHRLTGRRLALTQVAGLDALVVGGGGLVLTGASRRTIAPFTYLAISGIGLFVFSFVADLYASLGGTGRGSSLEVEVASTWQRFGHDGFATLTRELSFNARLNLAELGPALVGSFVDASLGLGLQMVGYHATGGGGGQEAHALLLTRFAYGVYLGETGEIAIAYDHRRDGLEGGLSTDSIGAGNIGFLDLRGRGWFPRAPRWGVEGSITAGSAWIVGASLLHRGGALSAAIRVADERLYKAEAVGRFSHGAAESRPARRASHRETSRG